MFDSNTLTGVAVNASTACLVLIALERYVKICHSVWHRNHFRRWMIHVGVALCWLDGVLIYLVPAWITTRYSSTECDQFNFPSQQLSQMFNLLNLIWQIFIPLAIFAVCYWRIYVLIRRQSKVNSVENQASSGQKPLVSSTQKNVVKTMIYVTVCFGVCWLPMQSYIALLGFGVSATNMLIMLALTVLTYINPTLNPLVYAVNYEVFRKSLRVLLADIGLSKAQAAAGGSANAGTHLSTIA